MLYSTKNHQEISFVMTPADMIKTCFKLTINGELKVHGGFEPKLKYIMHKIYRCTLTKLELYLQEIDLKDYKKLVSNKTEICILEDCKIIAERQNSFVYTEADFYVLLSHLPNIKEFKYRFCLPTKDLSSLAKKSLINENNENLFSSSNGQLKRRKLSIGDMSSSTIELEVLKFDNQKLKEYVKKLEAEKLGNNYCGCSKDSLEDTVSKLQNLHKTEIKSINDEYSAKFKIFDAEKQEQEAKIKELTDEISSMKIIKTEIKDSVENEREEMDKMKAEIVELKNQNSTLENKYEETTAANQELEQKCKELEAIINKSATEYQPSTQMFIQNPQTFSQIEKEEAELPGSIALGNQRFIVGAEYKRKKYVHIREYYRGKDGSLAPGKKGICLTIDQMKTLSDKIPEIKEKFLQ